MIGALVKIAAAEIATVTLMRRRRGRRARRPPPDGYPGRKYREPYRDLRPASGTCTLCSGPVTGRRRTWCSDRCVELWRLATTRPVQVAHLRAVYDGCWSCGRQGGPVEVDHVRPLWSLTTVERYELRWWLPGNLQLLCPECHKGKTAREARDRALVRSRS